MLPFAAQLVLASASTLFAVSLLPAQDLSGRWVYEENGQVVELDVRHDRPGGRASGTFAMFGQAAAFEAVVVDGTLVIQRLGQVRSSADNGAITAKLQSRTLMLTVTQPGQAPVTLAMTRRGDPASTVAPIVGGTRETTSASGAGYRVGTANEFAGEWQFASADETEGERLTLSVRGTDVTGEATSYERGYFSGRTTVKARVTVRGTLSNGALQLRIWPVDGSPNAATTTTGHLRGEYFILLIKGVETGYAKPGRALVQDADGSAEATAFARAVTGRVYSTTSQAGRRDGAIVGGRTRLALCSNGQIEYDFSDVGSVPGGGSLGSTVSRRGMWSVVLYAGAPTVMARWRGTGTSYSLTRFFTVRPDASGRSANVDGTDLAVNERC